MDGIDSATTESTRSSSKAKALDIESVFDAAALSQVGDAIIAVDNAHRITYWNAAAEALYGHARESAMGRFLPDLYEYRWLKPGDDIRAGECLDRDGWWRGENEHVLPDGRAIRAESTVTVVRDAEQCPAGMVAVIRDIGERVTAYRALSEREQWYRLLVDRNPDAIWVYQDGKMVFANPSAAVQLGLGSVADIVGKSPLDFIPEEHHKGAMERLAQLMAGEGVTTPEVILRPDGSLLDVEVTTTPVTYHDAPALLAVSRDITDRKRAERSLQAQVHRETLLNQIGQAGRSSLDPSSVQMKVSALLGKALGADRCYYAAFNRRKEQLSIAVDWHIPDLPPNAGEHDSTEYSHAIDELFQGGVTSIADTRDGAISPAAAALLESGDQRAVLAVPFSSAGQLVAAFVVGSRTPREWTEDEITLMDQAAVLTRAAVESARSLLREHNIAEQLQTALQPAIPAAVPGLRLAYYYRAALEEAGVGGDFADVFGDGKGTTFLVVADVSGKGLAAAAQVAAIRNMLRFALFNGRTVAGPVRSVSDTLEANRLLDGFATAFVARYEYATGTLTYVNGGQDAGLIRRAADGSIEQMGPTGTVIGAFPGTEYTEHAVVLHPGDTIALFTDGLTEAGRNRSTMLTGEGAARIFSSLTTAAGPEEVAQQMMAQVNAFAHGDVQDDQCLLVAMAN